MQTDVSSEFVAVIECGYTPATVRICSKFERKIELLCSGSSTRVCFFLLTIKKQKPVRLRVSPDLDESRATESLIY